MGGEKEVVLGHHSGWLMNTKLIRGEHEQAPNTQETGIGVYIFICM